MEKVLSFEELTDLITEIQDKVMEEITKANRLGTLTEVLKKYGYGVEEYSYCVPKYAKILVIGQSEVPQRHLEAIAKKYNIDKDRFDFVLDYNDAKNYPMETLKNNEKYSDIFVGPIPHKTNGMGNCSSIIAKIKNNQINYPKLTELKASNELKITKYSFQEALVHSQLLTTIL